MVEPAEFPGDSPTPAQGEGFDVSVVWHDRVVVLKVEGTLDMVSAPQLSESILTALTNEPAGIIADLSEVEFLASAGMTVLIAANEEVSRSARFGVVADGPATSRPMKLVGVDDILTIYPTIELALEDLRRVTGNRNT